jgi:hypothetical protein
MERESNNNVRYVPGESAENATDRSSNAYFKKKKRITNYLKGMSYEGNNIKNSELTNIYIYQYKK